MPNLEAVLHRLDLASSGDPHTLPVLTELVQEGLLKNDLPVLGKAARIAHLHPGVPTGLKHRLLFQALPHARHPAVIGPVWDLAKDLASTLDDDQRAAVLDALAAGPLELREFMSVPGFELCAAQRAVATLRLDEGRGSGVLRQAFELLVGRGEIARIRDAVDRAPDRQLSMVAASLFILFAAEPLPPGAVELVVDAGLEPFSQVSRHLWAWVGGSPPATRAAALVGVHAPEHLARFLSPAERDAELLMNVVRGLQSTPCAGALLVARFAAQNGDPRSVLHALSILFSDSREEPAVASVPGPEFEPDPLRSLVDLLDVRENDGRDLDSMGLAIALGAREESDRQLLILRLGPLAMAPSLAIARALVRFRGREDQRSAHLMQSWWSACASKEEQELVVLAVAVYRPMRLLAFFDTAPLSAMVPFLETRADAMLVDIMLDRPDALERLRLCVVHAKSQKLRARALAQLAKKGELGPDPSSIEELVESVDHLAFHRSAEPTAEESALVERLLARDRDTLVRTPWPLYAPAMTVEISRASRTIEGFQRAVDIVFAALGHQGAEASLPLRRLLELPIWDEVMDHDLALAHLLAPVTGEELDQTLARTRASLAFRWARSTKTPRPVRARAVLVSARRPQFDPAKVEVARDLHLVANLVDLALASRRHDAALDYAAARAAHAVVAHPLRDDDLEEQGAPIVRLREALFAFLRSQIDVGGELADQLRPRLQKVHHDKKTKRLEPPLERVRCWIEAVGWLRDRRQCESIDNISDSLRSDERALLEAPLREAREQMGRERMSDREAELRLVLRALRVGRAERRTP